MDHIALEAPLGGQGMPGLYSLKRCTQLMNPSLSRMTRVDVVIRIKTRTRLSMTGDKQVYCKPSSSSKECITSWYADEIVTHM